MAFFKGKRTDLLPLWESRVHPHSVANSVCTGITEGAVFYLLRQVHKLLPVPQHLRQEDPSCLHGSPRARAVTARPCPRKHFVSIRPVPSFPTIAASSQQGFGWSPRLLGTGERCCWVLPGHRTLQCPSDSPSASHWDPTASAVASQCLGKEARAEKPHFAPKFLLVSHSGSPTPAPTSLILCSLALSSKHPLGNNNITPIAESYDRTALPGTFTHFTLYSPHNHPATQTVALFTGEEAQSQLSSG